MKKLFFIPMICAVFSTIGSEPKPQPIPESGKSRSARRSPSPMPIPESGPESGQSHVQFGGPIRHTFGYPGDGEHPLSGYYGRGREEFDNKKIIRED